MKPVLKLLLLACPAIACAESLFVPVPDDPATVDGGLSRGVAFGDADGDGDADLLVANTINYPEFLYRNDGGRFVQVMETAPSLSGGFTEGVNWIDIDNDGDLDIFAVRSNAPNALYRNDSDWSFTEYRSGDLSTDNSPSSMACWADIDGDGWLDVFVANRNGENDAIYRNARGLSFERIADSVAGRAGGDARSCTFVDFDDDGDPDLYVGNFIDPASKPSRKQRNYLYFNEGGFTFVERRHGHAVESRSLTYGTSAADADNDGDLDLFVTNIGIGDQNHLYLNDGHGEFRLHDAGFDTEIDTPSKGHTWGDFDLDGDLDIAIANGTDGSQHIQNRLYLNDGTAQFIELRGEALVEDSHISAGVAWADTDTDGDLDLYVTNWADGDQDNVLYRNLAKGRWLKVTLAGTVSNQMAVGARVTLSFYREGKESHQARWLQAATGYASQNEPVLHFGLGDATAVEELSVDWPSGRRDTFRNVAANKHFRITESIDSGQSGSIHDVRGRVLESTN